MIIMIILKPETTGFKLMEIVISNHVARQDLIHHPI